MFRILKTAEFDGDVKRLDASEQYRVTKILRQLQAQGGDVGKPLAGFSFFREKKFDGKRLYFLVYTEIMVVLVLAISDKKKQQSTIKRILLDIAEYQRYVFEQIKK